MKLPRMSQVEAAVLAAAFAREIGQRSSQDNSAADEALDAALWELRCFKKAVREREEEP